MPLSYRQDEVLAWTLDQIGERWTLLILRDLLLGPKRFSDLSRELPRLSRNLLTARLRRLEAEGVVARRNLPPPAAARVYEVTEAGWSLARAIAPLAVWGARRMRPEQALDGFRPSTFALGMVAFADLEAAGDADLRCEFRVGEDAFHIDVADGRVRPYEGAAERPDVVVEADPATCLAIMVGRLTPIDAVRAGLMKAEGDPEAATRLLAVFPGPRLPGERTAEPVEAVGA